MWKSQVGAEKTKNTNDKKDDDDWETDPDFVNDVSEKEQRWGAKTLPTEEIQMKDMASLQKQVIDQHDKASQAQYEKNAFSRGYGGKFGVETRK